MLALVILPLVLAGVIPGREVDILTVLSFTVSLSAFARLVVRAVKGPPFTIDLAHSVFGYVFLCVIPLFQWRLGVIPLADVLTYRNDEVQWGNALVALWAAAYGLASSRRLGPAASVRRTVGAVSSARFVWTAALAFAALAYLGVRLGAGVVTRGALEDALAETSTPDMLLTGYFARVVPYVCLFACCLYARSARWRTLARASCALIFAGILVFDNPLAAARFWTASLGIAFLGLILPRMTRRGMLLAVLIGGGLVVGLPLLNLGRFALSLRDVDRVQFLSWQEIVGAGDFDAYGMLLATVRYVGEHGITWGRQLLGAALFWFPRAWWADKPIGSGPTVAAHHGLEWTNLSCPLPAEAYVNLGVAGVALGGAALGALVRKWDRSYWTGGDGRTLLINVAYPFAVGLFFFLCRGDLMSGTAYLCGMLVAAAVVAAAPFEARRARVTSVDGPLSS